MNIIYSPYDFKTNLLKKLLFIILIHIFIKTKIQRRKIIRTKRIFKFIIVLLFLALTPLTINTLMPKDKLTENKDSNINLMNFIPRRSGNEINIIAPENKTYHAQSWDESYKF